MIHIRQAAPKIHLPLSLRLIGLGMKFPQFLQLSCRTSWSGKDIWRLLV